MSGSDPDNPIASPADVERLLGTTDLADALESERFKQFLDHIPIAIAVAELEPKERIVYANIEFERLLSVIDNMNRVGIRTIALVNDAASPLADIAATPTRCHPFCHRSLPILRRDFRQRSSRSAPAKSS